MNSTVKSIADAIVSSAYDKELYIIIDAMKLDEDDPESNTSFGYIMVANTPDWEYKYNGVFVMGGSIGSTVGMSADSHKSQKEMFDTVLMKLIMDNQIELAKQFSVDVSKCINFAHDVTKAFRVNSYYIIRYPEGKLE